VKTDKLTLWLVVVVVMMMIGLGFLAVYQYTGLKYFFWVGTEINKSEIPKELKRQTWNNFIGIGTGYYGGVYAGDWWGRIWVWGKGGLRAFVTDDYSYYYFYDECKDNFSPLGPNENVEHIFPSNRVNEWKNEMKIGYQVRVRMAKDAIVGNLREIYAFDVMLNIPTKNPRPLCTN
jgi:hypothetical protein